jgi:pectin methylesterase-like acyl-CoA thioesterase
MKFKDLKKHLSFATVCILILSFVAQSAVLVNDTFADANSQNQVLPNSIRIFNGRTGTVRTDATGSVTFNTTSAGGSEGFWGFFTDGAPIDLAVGDKLINSVNFSAQNFNASNNAADLRFGVFDSKGTRTTANTTGGLNSPTFTDDTGYATRLAGTATSNTPPFTLHRRTTVPGATDPLANILGTEYTAITPVTGSPRAALSNDTPYTFTFTVERLSATDTRLTVSITDGGTFNINSSATESSATPNTTFDWFGFRVPNGLFSQITFTQWRAEYIPAGPSITSQPTPSNQTVSVGANVNYSVAATGSNLTYQWRLNGVNIDTTVNPSAATSTLNLTNVQTSDAGVYDVVVSNESGSVTSDGVTLNVTSGPVDPAPVITDQPDDTVVTIGSPAALSVTASGNNLFYQWYRNGVLISGATGSTLNFPNAQLSDSGVYTVVVSNSGGTVTSMEARLTVVSPIMAIGLEPPTGATNVCIDTPLRITFNQTPVPGTSGLIRVFRSDGTLFDTINMGADTVPTANVPGTQSSRPIGGASSGGLPVNFNYYPILVNGTTASIYLHQKLEYNQTYYILLDAGAIVDENGAPFAGISDPNAWRFTTRFPPPTAGTMELTVSANGLMSDGITPADFCTVQGAVDFVPTNNSQRVTINVRNGVYDEIVYVRSNKRFVTVRGESREGTIIQYANNENLNTGTTPRSLFGVDAPDFILETITLHNTTSKLNASGQTRQAEAFRGNNDRIMLDHVNLKSFQDTLLLQTQTTQGAFVNESYIEGDVDFTWGAGTAYFRNTELKDVNPGTGNTNAYYSQIRNPQGKRGNVYVNTRLTRAAGTPDNSAWLSRIDPDDFPYSEVIWIDSLMDTHIRPEGWRIDNPSLAPTPANYPNIRFWEYNSRDINTGLPIDCSQRHPISRNDCNNPLTAEEADFYRNPANVLGWSPVFVQDYSISGTVTYGNTATGNPVKFVPGVTLTAAGSPQVTATTDSSGAYSLNGLGAGAYTVTPSKTGDLNGIESLDAARIQQHLVGLITLTPNQLIAADVDNNGVVNSLDAARIQQYLVGIQSANIIGQWKFVPVNRQYSSLSGNLTGENYEAVLIGDVSGNWAPTQQQQFAKFSQTEAGLSTNDNQNVDSESISRKIGQRSSKQTKQSNDELIRKVDGQSQTKTTMLGSSVNVSLPANATASTGSAITIPVTIGAVPAGSPIESFDFTVFYDPAVLQAVSPFGSNAGTLSANCSVLANSPTAGRVVVSGACATAITTASGGVLYNLNFNVIGTSGQRTGLLFNNPATGTQTFQFNSGTPAANTTNGLFTVLGPTAAPATIKGRVLTNRGRAIPRAQVVITGPDGVKRYAGTNSFGYYQFNEVTAGETYVINVSHKQYRFVSQVISLNESLSEVNITAQ